MYRKFLIITAIFCIGLIAACRQPNPTPINSTQHKHEGQNSASPNSMNHGNMNHSGMNHSGMNHSEMKSAPNAAALPFDLQFLDTMIHHHEGAVEMAKPVAAKGANAELKIFAAKIIADQEKEIAQMKLWREQWFAGQPSALNMEMAGMTDSMKGMDMAKMNAASGAAFDLEFINQMTPHHQGAIVMAREVLTKSERPEIKTLANQIILAQDGEIKQMQAWKTQWVK